MKRERSINAIINDKLLGRISKEDYDYLQTWIESSAENRENYQRLMHGKDLVARFRQYGSIDEERAWEKFQEKNLKSRRFTFGKVMRYAAILMLPVVGVASWLLLGNDTNSKPVLSYESQVSMIRSERLGKQKATLVLPSGKKVALQSSLSRSVQDSVLQPVRPVADVKEQEGETVTTDNNKLITYHDSEFWVTFEDGTKVHLNYNTTLRYPSHFSSTYRMVYLDGEAYFQIAKDSKRPFMVVTRDGVIKQYGTSFNLSTHTGATKVVLVEGSISVSLNQGGEYKMNPGELAVIESGAQNVQISKVDVEPYIAWNEGRFIFDNCSLESLMNVISGWYGKEVMFESDDIKNMHFTGDMDRYESITPVLKAIQRVTGLDVKVTEKKIILSNRNNNH